MLRDLEFRQMRFGMGPKLGGVQFAAIGKHHGSADLLAKHTVGDGKGDHLLDGRMFHQHVIDLERRDLLAAAVDDFLEASGDFQIAVTIEESLVAGTEPATGET